MAMSRYVKFVLPALALGFVATAPALAGETHQYEVSASWRNSDSDSMEGNFYTLSGEIYFAPVDSTDKPLAEAYFLNRIGSVFLLGSRSDYDFESSNTGIDGDGFGVGIAYTRPGLPFLFQALYSTSDLEYDPPFSAWKSSSDAYTVSAGYYLQDSLLASVIYRQVESELQAGSTHYDLTHKMYGVSAKYVNLLSSSTAYNLVGGYTFMEDERTSGANEDDWSLSLVGDYYFTNLISLGAGLELTRGDSESGEGEEYLVRSKTFFTHNIGVELEYSRFEAKNTSGEDDDSIQIAFVSHF